MCVPGYNDEDIISFCHLTDRNVLLAAAMFLMWELSTPCVYVRWFLYNLGKHDTKAYIINGLAMLATFFFARNVLGLSECYSSVLSLPWHQALKHVRHCLPKSLTETRDMQLTYRGRVYILLLVCALLPRACICSFSRVLSMETDLSWSVGCSHVHQFLPGHVCRLEASTWRHFSLHAVGVSRGQCHDELTECHVVLQDGQGCSQDLL